MYTVVQCTVYIYSSKQYRGLQPGEYPCQSIVAKLSLGMQQKIFSFTNLVPRPMPFQLHQRTYCKQYEKLGGAWGQGYSFTISVAYSAPVKYKNWDL